MNESRLLLISALIFSFFSFVTLAQPHGPEVRPVNVNLTTEQWREDLKFFAAEVPRRHKNAFHAVSKEKWEAAVADLDKRLPSLKSDEVLVGFLRLIAMIGDGHTSIEEQSLFNFGIYPVRYYAYTDGIYVQTAHSDYADLVGKKLVKIGNTPIDKALDKLDDLTWADNYNAQSKKVEAVFLLSNPKVLQGLKLADTDESVDITVESGGEQKTVRLKAVRDVMTLMQNGKFVAANANAKSPIPLYLRDDRNFYWYEYQKDSKILYVQFNAVLNKPDESITAFFKRVFDFADANPVDKLVLDIRGNTGGNNQLNKPIVVGLIRSKLNERGKLFVIIGRRTFSAAENLLNEIEKYTNAILVGEPTGSSPNLYGDPIVITLPNSKLPFRVSTLWHQIDPRDTRTNTFPDIFAEITPDDFRNNVDPAINAIVNYAPGRTIKDIAALATPETGIDAFLKKYREFKSDPANKFVNSEAIINALGYRFVQSRKLSEAIEIFKLNVEAYPSSANVYDSLGEAYMLNGNRNDAIKSYEKALSLNPSAQSAADALRRLKPNQ